MDHAQLKEILYARIESADAGMLRQLVEFTNEFFISNQGGYTTQPSLVSEPGSTALREPRRGRMTHAEMTAEIEESRQQYREGRYKRLEDLAPEFEQL